ncbi:hypothetical protein M2404_003722 [Rheinheimera pacifica]|uniref:hypothetical protein n=1 Tax=Rheinheimera pacifica TaxID=173990 RepID=UPI002166F04D|nr:hypothetical protein [Rheinheimera pacifica]MCS4309351.1 hypothetical protein [Rheinheimera pacifica]
MENEWLAYRIVHSAGGIRLINGYGPSVKISPNAINGKIATFQTSSYRALFSSIEEVGLPILGIEFFTHSGQFKGTDIPEWGSYYKSVNKIWSSEEAVHLWGDIGTGAHKAENGRLWDVASRVSQQLRVCGWRLKELSDSYYAQLLSIAEQKDFSRNSSFLNGYTWLCYLAIQSFLIDICILRDYLAEFSANFLFPLPKNQKSLNITTMAGLKKHCMNGENLNDPLIQMLDKITSKSGWLKELGEYRDLVVHSAPLAQAERKLFVITKTKNISGGEIPSICCPIPKNPHEISISRANGSMFKSFEEQLNKYIGVGKDDGDHIDGLEYCYDVLGKISLLALQFADRSPVKPQRIIFDSSNIIGGVQTSHE